MHNPSGFGIYVHWPFCRSKCPYCDFNSHAVADIDQDVWRQALLTELDWYAPKAAGQTVTSIFFGGGTPSLMDPATVEAVIDAIVDVWDISRGIEVTLEANPTSAESQRFRDFRTAGVNRLSLGVQALNDTDLHFLGRRHSVNEGLAAIELAKKVFNRSSFDLIYARPGQTASQWMAELSRALSLGTDHLSLYQLTVEEGTALAPRYAAGEFSLPGEDEQADMFALTRDLTEAAGLPAYEISNHARPGMECHHNLTYWLGGDYLGIGPGAHGRLWTLATAGHHSPTTWLHQVLDLGHGSKICENMSAAERAMELVMTGLRTRRGIHRRMFFMSSGMELDPLLNADHLAQAVADGLVTDNGSVLAPTAQGHMVLNWLTERLLG